MLIVGRYLSTIINLIVMGRIIIGSLDNSDYDKQAGVSSSCSETNGGFLLDLMCC